MAVAQDRYHYRLPTDEEWTFAAAEKARDEALPLVDPTDPAQAWIARYEAESARSRPAAIDRAAGRHVRHQQQRAG